jgi:hypothetical protein
MPDVASGSTRADNETRATYFTTCLLCTLGVPLYRRFDAPLSHNSGGG